MDRPAAAIRYGLVGFGRIGRRVARHLAGSDVALAAVLVRAADRASAASALAEAGLADAGVVADVEGLAATGIAVAVECAGTGALAALGPPILAAGIDLLPLSLAALADPATERSLRLAAERGPGRIEVPAGAMGSLDALAAAREDDLREVVIRVAYPASRLVGTPAAASVDLTAMTGPALVASGSVRDLARRFPRHLNVTVGVALAGLGLDATRAELVADPALRQAAFTLTARAGPGALLVEVGPRDVPLGADPADYTAFSVVRLLRRRSARIAP